MSPAAVPASSWSGEWSAAVKLDWVRGKLGRIPAFGDFIGRDVNKAEIGVCVKMVESVAGSLALAVAALEAVAGEFPDLGEVDLSDDERAKLAAVRAALVALKGGAR